jgi:protein-tyrosine kinase
MDQEQNSFTTNDDPAKTGEERQASSENRLVRLIKSIVVSEERPTYIDESVIQFKYYNSFNYSLLSRGNEDVTLTLGITSPRQGEGKTLVACNLAASFAMGAQKKTVLVDLNVFNPRLHRVFGIEKSPGLAEALRNGTIHISRTAIEHLSVLTAGRFLSHPESMTAPTPHAAARALAAMPRPFLGLDLLPAFRDVIYSLEQEFEMVIVDMPAMNLEGVPVLFANHLNGLLVVINSGRTKQEDLDAMFHQVNERQVLGFVFNRFRDGGGA